MDLLVLRDQMDEELEEKSIKKLFKIIRHCNQLTVGLMDLGLMDLSHWI